MLHTVNYAEPHWLGNNISVIFMLCFVAAGGPNDNSTTTNQGELCTCINQCKVVTYSSTVSAASLTGNNILRQIKNGRSQHVIQNFLNASEIAQRVDESEMFRTVKQLQTVIYAQDTLNTMVEYYTVTEATSVSTQLFTIFKSLFAMLQSSVNLNRELQAQMDSVYEQYVDWLVTDVTSAMQSADLLYAQVTTTFIASPPSGDSDLIASLITQLESVVQKLESFNHNLNATSSYASNFFPKQLLASTTCRSATENLNTTLVERIDWLSGFPSPSKFDAVTDLRKASNLRSLLSDTINCMQAYKTELDNFLKFLDSVQLPTFVSSELSATQVDAVSLDGKELGSMLLEFLNASMTKSELAQRYLNEVKKNMESNANKLVNDAKESVFTKIDTNIEIFKQSLELFFDTLFATYVRLQKYMASKDTGIEEFARWLDIWRLPAVNFQSSKVGFSTRFC